MAGRKLAGMNASVTNTAEEQASVIIRAAVPWLAWLVATPLAAVGFTGLGTGTHHRLLVAALLGGTAAAVAWFSWRMSHSRGIGRFLHGMNALVPLGWIAAVTARGWTGFGGLLLIAWAVGGLGLCLAHNIRYAVRREGGEVDVLTAGAGKPKAVDTGYVVRVLAGRLPAIRALAEKAGKVVPVLVGPWREHGTPAITAVPVLPAITAGPPADHVDPAAQARAQAAASALARNFRDFTARKATDLNGAQMKVADVKPWRIRTEIRLVRGVHIPKHLIDYREHLASQNGLPLSAVVIRANPVNHARVFLDFVLEDVLADVRHWPGPAAIGKSIADAPVRYGIYEDRVYAESWEPAITAELAKRLGVSERNLSHIISEGMTGSGKSTIIRIILTDGATRLDVEDWAADPVKKFQTLGCVAGALNWFAVDIAESKAMVKFLATQVIPARANYLGMHGYDNWEAGCGLPFLRVTVEEGNIVADELDHLDAVLNSARSAGVKIRASFQRAHHAVVDTNVRGAFGESLSFGVKDSGDVFVLPDELLHAGADPSQWADRQPGMHYRSASGIDLQRQLMPVRSFQVAQEYCREVIAEHAPARDAWIAENCPDWAQMLRRLDANGVYANRTTGAAVLSQMEAAECRKSARTAPAEPSADAAPLATVSPLPARPPARMSDDEEIFDATIVDDEEVTMDELDLDDADLVEGIGEDGDTDPNAPVPPADPAEDEAFPFPPRERPSVPRDEAVARLRDLIAGLGSGREFTPRDIYEQACRETGKSASWVRGELLGTLAAEGLVLPDRGTGIYTVTEKAAA